MPTGERTRGTGRGGGGFTLRNISRSARAAEVLTGREGKEVGLIFSSQIFSPAPFSMWCPLPLSRSLSVYSCFVEISRSQITLEMVLGRRSVLPFTFSRHRHHRHESLMKDAAIEFTPSLLPYSLFRPTSMSLLYSTGSVSPHRSLRTFECLLYVFYCRGGLASSSSSSSSARGRSAVRSLNGLAAAAVDAAAAAAVLVVVC